MIAMTIEREETGATIARRVAALREKKGITQYALAKSAGVSHPYISLLESGGVKRPKFDTLRKIADALEVPFEDVVGTSGSDVEDVDTDLAQAKRISRILPTLQLPDAETFLVAIAELPPHEQAYLLDMVKSMRKRRKSEDDNPRHEAFGT